MELRIDINNRRKQFAGIGRDDLCDFQYGVQYEEQIGELRQLVQVVGRAIKNQELPDTSESQDLLDVVVDSTALSPPT